MLLKSKIEPYNASKWLSVAFLIDEPEICTLFESLDEFQIFPVGSVVSQETGPLSHDAFIKCYGDYIQALKKGLVPEDSMYRSVFTSIFTVSEDHVYAFPVGAHQQLIRVAKPVIQVQAHQMDYSKADGKFRSMVLGKDSILWGLQFSYPQLFEDSKTHEALKVDLKYPNTKLFRSIQKWMRNNTVPTPFIVGQRLINVPIRLGKNCFSWINQHPQFAQKALKVDAY